MTKKAKFFLFFFLFLTISNSCFAAYDPVRDSEVKIGVTEKKDLIPQFVSKLFGTVTISFAGGLAILFFVIGAIRYMASFGSAERMRDAKGQMIASIFGLILTLSSYLILKTINPQLTSLKEPDMLTSAAMFYLTGVSPKASLPSTEIYDTSILRGAKGIEWPATIPDPKKPGETMANCDPTKQNLPYIIKSYSETGYKGTETRTYVKCGGGSQGFSGKSIKLVPQTAGVYLYSNPTCAETGPMLGPITSSQNSLPSEFNNKDLCVSILNDPIKRLKYGAIVHQNVFLNEETEGRCSTIILDQLKNAGNFLSSISVFLVSTTARSSGDGVSFYSKPFGDVSTAGVAKITDEAIRAAGPYFEKKANEIIFSFDPTATDEEKALNNFNKKAGSVQNTGGYLTVLYASGGGEGAYDFCWPVSDNSKSENLEARWIGGGKKIDYVYIIRLEQ